MLDYDNTFETMEASCDECSHSDTFEGTWHECIDEMKSQGWKIRKKDGDFIHVCPDHEPQPVWEKE